MNIQKTTQRNRFLYKIIFFVLLLSFSTKAQIQKVDPPFWYAGMKNPAVQIMFYGKNIAQYETSVSNNVTIKNVEKTENPNYLFVTIDTQNLKASELVFSFKLKNKV
ncbi:alpha-amlyase, partial [Flavobacterium circumlabens]